MSQVLIKESGTLIQKEAEANAREIYVKMWEHQQRFRCHVDGCTNASAGPKLEEYLNHWLWDWHQPTELA